MPFDFDANKTVEDLNTVPEDFRPFYEEGTDGTFSLSGSAPVTSAVKVIGGLYKTVGNVRREVDTLKGKQIDLGPLKEYGEDPEAIATAITAKIEEIKKSGKSDADTDAAVEKLRKDLTDVHVAEKNKWGEDRNTLVSQIRSLLVDNKINEAIGDKTVSPVVARRVIADFVDIEQDENGNFRTIVKDEQGGARKRVTDGQLVTVDDLVKELMGKEEFQPLFKSDAPRGAGSPPGGPGRKIQSALPEGHKKSSFEKIRDGLAKRQRSRV